jgi:hypothetical protein
MLLSSLGLFYRASSHKERYQLFQKLCRRCRCCCLAVIVVRCQTPRFLIGKEKGALTLIKERIEGHHPPRVSEEFVFS